MKLPADALDVRGVGHAGGGFGAVGGWGAGEQPEGERDQGGEDGGGCLHGVSLVAAVSTPFREVRWAMRHQSCMQTTMM